MMPGTTNLPVRSTTVAFGGAARPAAMSPDAAVLHHDRDVGLRRRAGAVDHGGVGESGGLRRRAPADERRRGEYDQDIRPHYPSLEHRLFCFFTMTAAPSYQRNGGKVHARNVDAREGLTLIPGTRSRASCGTAATRSAATIPTRHQPAASPRSAVSTKIIGSPREITSERRRFSSISGPRMKPEHQRRRLAAELDQKI